MGFLSKRCPPPLLQKKSINVDTMLKKIKKTRYSNVTEQERVKLLEESIKDMEQRGFANDILNVYRSQLQDLKEFIKKEQENNNHE